MKVNIVVLLINCAIISAVVEQVLPKQLDNDSNRNHSAVRLPRLFSFEYYKDVFKKTYTSLGEELVRRKLVLARAFRAFVSGVAYKYKQSKFYLALNKRSDRTPAELLELDSQIAPIARKSSSDGAHKVEKPQTETPSLVDEVEIRTEFRTISRMSKSGTNPAYTKLAQELPNLDSGQDYGKKRGPKEVVVRSDFSFDELIKRPRGSDGRANTKRRTKGSKLSNNPHQKQPEVVSQGSYKLAEPAMSRSTIDSLLARSNSTVSQSPETNSLSLGALVKSFFSSSTSHSSVIGRQTKEDVLITDHRDCMTDAKDQGTCSSCYAFVATAFYEWLICKQTGELITLSEQYIVDCGPEGNLYKGLHGCRGGQIPYTGFFFESSGAELGTTYPYMGMKGSCPYDNFASSKLKAGFFRFGRGTGNTGEIAYNLFETYLKRTPLTVAVGSGGSFYEYGGGIHNDKKCCRKPGDDCGTHAVLIVGQGVADGEGYWLIRNSFSTAYGEDGYYKMSKQADCIWPKFGYVFAFEDDGRTVPLNAKRNSKRPAIESKIKDRSRYPSSLVRWILGS